MPWLPVLCLGRGDTSARVKVRSCRDISTQGCGGTVPWRSVTAEPRGPQAGGRGAAITPERTGHVWGATLPQQQGANPWMQVEDTALGMCPQRSRRAPSQAGRWRVPRGGLPSGQQREGETPQGSPEQLRTAPASHIASRSGSPECQSCPTLYRPRGNTDLGGWGTLRRT